MKTYFIHATAAEEITLTEEALKQLPKKIGLVTNAQHIAKLPDIKKQLPNAIMAGQVLGCRADNAQKIAEQVDAFLFIGGGAFHPLFVALKTGKIVYCWNPADKLLSTITQEQIEAHKKDQTRQLNIFYAAQNVGVLVSTKQGQSDNKINAVSTSLKMKQPLLFQKRTDKKYYLFTFDTLHLDELENFPFIDCWVNTACSRITDEKNNIVNADDIIEYEKEHALSYSKSH